MNSHRDSRTDDGLIRQSATYWSFRDSVEDFPSFARSCREMGLAGVDLVDPADWKAVRDAGLVATMVPGAGTITDGLNDKANHRHLLEEFGRSIPAAAEAGWPNVITFSGSRRGMGDEEGLEACEAVLRQAVRIAEDHGVTICLELLNSRVDHPDYQCDRTPWGAELCRRVGSPRLKLLYDIYHMQIMEGDVIRTIEQNIDVIGHFHTGGNPGRADLDDEQELNYPPIARAIARLAEEGRYCGYVAHEFVPKHGLDSLAAAAAIWRAASPA